MQTLITIQYTEGTCNNLEHFPCSACGITMQQLQWRATVLLIFSLSVAIGGHAAKILSQKATLNGLLLGIYDNGDLTAEASAYDNSSAGGLTASLQKGASPIAQGTARIFYGLDLSFDCVAVVGLGPSSATYDNNEDVDLKLENIRIAVAAGIRALRDNGETHVFVDSCGDATAAAEGTALALYSFEEYKTNKTPLVAISPYSPANQAAWDRGIILAEGQNVVNELQDTPANILTPTEFANRAQTLLQTVPAPITITAHNQAWAESKGMGSFLSVAKGSEQPPVFLEIHYNNSDIVDEPPVIFVGKGINFDSGGISLKSPDDMGTMRADMTGAAHVVSIIYTLARLGEKVNVIGIACMTENMPSGKASRPSDVVTAMNGKTIQIDDTDAEGRLVLADGLVYANTQFTPAAIIDIATLTGSIMTALGAEASGVFSTSDAVWDALHQAGIHTGDRVWRMPLFKQYTDIVRNTNLGDLNNAPSYGGAGASTAAAFLKEFVTTTEWAHVDIAGVMTNGGQVKYLGGSMSGRPLRTLVEFVPEYLASFRK